MTVHIIGAGLAGLAAAIELVERGIDIVIHEAAPVAGGRCRSWFDDRLGAVLDTGTHVILGAYRETWSYLDRLGARDRLVIQEHARLDMVDLGDDRRWSLMPRAAPWWWLSESGGVPGATWRDTSDAIRLLFHRGDRRVAELVDPASALTRRLWNPLCRGILNTEPDKAAAHALARALRHSVAAGERACRLALPRKSLGDALIEPALTKLADRGVVPSWNHPLLACELGKRVLVFADTTIPWSDGDAVALMVPPWDLARVTPNLVPPVETTAIINGYFRLDTPITRPAGPGLLGVVGGAIDWIAWRDDIIATTSGAADSTIGDAPHQLALRIWRDTADVLGLAPELPARWRIVKSRRATPLQDPRFEMTRPACRTADPRVFLGGDWVATGLPATIESAIASGREVAREISCTLAAR